MEGALSDLQIEREHSDDLAKAESYSPFVRNKKGPRFRGLSQFLSDMLCSSHFCAGLSRQPRLRRPFPEPPDRYSERRYWFDDRRWRP
jgi:hypothetical protein